ncbi:MAG: LysM peptidoglycan-binding domain-containing protein [Planctomycetes bacterium]|nr:LysM peptidoglycan-binding domain-containing protein [Planctomycetota bacterium]
MSVGFRLLLIVLIGFCALCVYQLREGELAVWLRNSPAPRVQSLPGEVPLEGLVGNDTVIETTIKATSIGRHPRVTRRSTPRWDRPSIEAGEPAVDIRRSSANTPSVPENAVSVESRPPEAGERAEPLNLVNPGRSVTPVAERQPPAPQPAETPAAVETPVEPKLEPPKVSYTIHTVKDGDKLWNLAEKYLGRGHRYKKIIELNKKELGDNPERLRVGMKLRIPPKK